MRPSRCYAAIAQSVESCGQSSWVQVRGLLAAPRVSRLKTQLANRLPIYTDSFYRACTARAWERRRRPSQSPREPAEKPRDRRAVKSGEATGGRFGACRPPRRAAPQRKAGRAGSRRDAAAPVRQEPAQAGQAYESKMTRPGFCRTVLRQGVVPLPGRTVRVSFHGIFFSLPNGADGNARPSGKGPVKGKSVRIGHRTRRRIHEGVQNGLRVH